MEIYNKSSPEYEGYTLDNLNRHVDGFIINEEIHLVYNFGESKQSSSKRPVKDIVENPDKYLWTPYLYFACKK